MRAAHHDMTLIGDPAFGVSLGFDFVAEHEYGIGDVERALGVERNAAPGVDRRRVHADPEALGKTLRLVEFNKATKQEPAETRLFFVPGSGSDDERLASRKGAPFAGFGRDLATGWDAGGFMIRAFTDETRDFLRGLHAAFLKGEVAIGQGAAGPFGGSPLTLVNLELAPQEVFDAVEKSDKNHDALMEADKATGIHALLREGGKKYFALKPAWVEGFESLKGFEGKPSKVTDHDVIYFLNPMEQRENNFGWFTVEELEAWACDEGPVIKGNARAEAAPEP